MKADLLLDLADFLDAVPKEENFTLQRCCDALKMEGANIETVG